MAAGRVAGAVLAEIGAPGLSSDRINYVVGESPFYEINSAPPSQPLHWLIARKGQETVSWVDPAQRTDESGRWSGEGGVWTDDLIGFYTITAQVADWSARTCFTVIERFESAPGKAAADLIGVVHVAGDYRFAGPGTPFGDAPFLVEGAQQILSLGARRGFFYLTPQYKTSDYRFDDFGSSPITRLVELAASLPYRNLFAQPFEQFVLTTYTFSNWDWVLDRAQGEQSVPFDPEAETAEVADLVAYLAAEYPDKKFILKNWEGDWQVQGNYDIDGIPTPERIREFIAWMQARQAGVVRGRAVARNAESVQHAIEFNLLSHSVRDAPGVLHDVVPEADSDLISYASWETSNQFDTRRMKDAIAFIERVPENRGRKVLIAEFGLSNTIPNPDADTHLEALLQAFLEMDVNAFFWEIYNNGLSTGLIGPSFQRFDTWFKLREELGARNDATMVRDPAFTNVPEVMDSGEAVTVRVTFTNTGKPWFQSVGHQIQLLGPGLSDLGAPVWLPHDVVSGGQVTFRFDFTAPHNPGTCRFQMAQLGIEVFGEAVLFEVRTAAEDRSAITCR